MRSLLLLLGTLLLAVGGFVAYRAFQHVPPRVADQKDRVATPVELQGRAPRVLDKIAEGGRPWIRNIDRLGRLTSRFRADEYVPQGGGRVHVIHPQAEFFQYPSGREQRVQRIWIESKTGDIEVQQPSHASGSSASSGSGQASLEKGAAGPPKRGRLKDDVTIRIYPDAYGPHQAEPSITLVTDNMTFDNETFEVTTAAFTDKDGRRVEADEVPIAVTGDYEFQGRGLKLRWNDLDGRLEYLEVAHGDYLTVLHPGANGAGGLPLFGGGEGGKGSAEPAGAPPTAPALLASDAVPAAVPAAAPAPAPSIPAAAPPAPARARPGAKPAPPKPARHGPQPPYVATFDSDVRISQGERGVSEKQLATADQMTVDFLTGQSKATTRPTTAPAAMPPAAPAAVQPDPAVVAGAAPVAPAVAAAAPATGPTTGPTTHPSELAEAVTVRWSGKLHVVPVDSATSAPLKPGESIVHLSGQREPVHATRDGNDVRCARLDYRSPEGDVALYHSPAFPQVVLRQQAGAGAGPHTRPAAVAEDGAPPPDEAVIGTEAVDYSGIERVAVLHGNSEAQVRLKPDPADAARPEHRSERDLMDLKWQKLARIYFLDRASFARAANGPAAHAAQTSKTGMPGAQQLAIDHAHFEGDVQVRHPQLALNSLALDAEFDPPGTAAAPTTAPSAAAVNPDTAPIAGLPTTRPAATKDQANLRRLIATGAVTCQVTDETGKRQNIECRQMVMDTAMSPAGKLYPKKIDFDGGPSGDAHAFDPTQDVRAAHIQATFVPSLPIQPTTRPSTAPSADTSEEPAVATATSAPRAPGAPASPAGPTTRPGPATRPAELDTVTASGRVRVATADGALATADQMFVKMVDSSPHVRLTGTPAAPGTAAVPARVVDAKKDVFVGPVITADPKLNNAAIEGSGTMHLIREAPAQKPTTRQSPDSPQTNPPSTLPTTNPAAPRKPRPIDVAFKTGAVMDSANNVIDVRDAVSIVSTDPDGTVNTATGHHARITLADKPPEPAHTGVTDITNAVNGPNGVTPASPPAVGASTTTLAPAVVAAAQPAPGGTTRPSTRPTKDKSTATSMDAMKGKVVTGVVLEKDAVVKSSLADAQGAILREFELKSELIRYVLASAQPGAKGKIIVPVPGQMLVRDHRPPGTANPNGGAKGAGSAVAGPGAATPADPGQSRGATAFQWSKDLTYDEATYTAVLTGDVWIVHKDDDPKSEPARLRADRVVAVFEPRPNPAAKAARAPGAPAGAPADPASALQLKSMTATGNVSVARAGSTLTAPRMDYDPATGWMNAVGTDRFPASYADAEGVNSCTARQIDWNAQNWNVKFKDIIARTGQRPGPPPPLKQGR